MKQILILLATLLALTIEKFCTNCWGCPQYMYVTCLRTDVTNNFYFFDCKCIPDGIWQDHLIKLAKNKDGSYNNDPQYKELYNYKAWKVCTGRDQWAYCYHNNQFSPELFCQCEYI